LRAEVLVDPEKPKVSKREVVSMLKAAGVEHSAKADFGVVVGGDGLFSHYGRKTSIPLLFVGTRSEKPTDSKAHLAEVLVEDLEPALRAIAAGKFTVEKYGRLGVSVSGSPKGESFTDISLEKGADSNCIRYTLRVKGAGLDFTDWAVSNGVVITTKAGSTGYFSYIDKLRMGDTLEPSRFTVIGKDEVGVCHIAPTFTSREGASEHPLRYVVPWGAVFTIKLMRDADAHLFGVTRGPHRGIRITTKDTLVVRPSRHTTNVMRLLPA
jgi:hypothetical protein